MLTRRERECLRPPMAGGIREGGPEAREARLSEDPRVVPWPRVSLDPLRVVIGLSYRDGTRLVREEVDWKPLSLPQLLPTLLSMLGGRRRGIWQEAGWAREETEDVVPSSGEWSLNETYGAY